MKHTSTIIALIAAALLAACEPKESGADGREAIVYVVASSAAPAMPETSRYSTEAEHDALIDRLCTYAEQGKAVTFHNANRVTSKGTKDATTISTTSREEIKAWMRQMEDAGKTVTVTYNRATGTWQGTAYVHVPQPVEAEGPRVSRVTFDYSFDSTGISGMEEHIVCTYTWDGDLLTAVETMERYWLQYADGSTGDTTGHAGHIQLTYSGSQCVAVGGNRYAYLDGLLVQEWHGDDRVSYTYIYDNEGQIVDYLITDTVSQYYGGDSYDEEVTVPGYHIEWENGDAVRAYGDDREVPIWTYEYDGSLRPRAVTLGITTLLPGYQGIFEPLTRWSRHNMTGQRFNGSDTDGRFSVTYTYDAAGRPVTATLPRWLNGGHGHWTFEYID